MNCFNENTNNVQNFYFNNWENDNQTTLDNSVTKVGVRIQQILPVKIITEYFTRYLVKEVEKWKQVLIWSFGELLQK